MLQCGEPLNASHYEDAPGVQIEAIDFGGLDGIRSLDTGSLAGATSYMAPLIDALEQKGYRAGEDLFGAPYDWRCV